MTTRTLPLLAGLAFPLTLVLAACGGSSTTTPTGTVSVSVTDAPAVDYDAVWVTVKGIRFHSRDTASPDDSGWQTYTLPAPVTVNLAALNNGTLQDVFGTLSLPAGQYHQIRLQLAGPFETLTSSAGAQSLSWNDQVDFTDGSGSHHAPLELVRHDKGIALHGAFTVASGTPLHLAVDFDLEDSILKFDRGAVKSYALLPVLRVFDRDNAGAITGQIDPASLYPANASGGYNVIVKAEDLSLDGTRHYVVRATTLKPDGSFRLYPLPIPAGASTHDFDVMIRGRNMETLIVKNVQVSRSSDGTSNATVLQSTALTAPAGTEYTANLAPAASPTGGWVNFFQTPASESVPYEIRIHPLNPFTGTFATDFPLSAGNLHTGNWAGGGAISFGSSVPVQGTGGFTAVDSAPRFQSASLAVAAGTSPVTLNFGPLSVNTAVASSDSISGSVTQSTPGQYDRGFLVASRDGMIVTTLDLTTTLALNGGAGGGYSLPALPGGSMAVPRPELVYYLYAVVWNSTAPGTSYQVVPVASVADLSHGSAGNINLAL